MSNAKTQLLDIMPENVRKAVIKEVSELLEKEGWKQPNKMELTNEDIKRWSKGNQNQNEKK